jgi:hypothetical protein
MTLPHEKDPNWHPSPEAVERLARRLEDHGDSPMYATRFRGLTLVEEAASTLRELSAALEAERARANDAETLMRKAHADHCAAEQQLAKERSRSARHEREE